MAQTGPFARSVQSSALRVPTEAATTIFRLRQKQAEKLLQEIIADIEKDAGALDGGKVDAVQALISQSCDAEVNAWNTVMQRLDALGQASDATSSSSSEAFFVDLALAEHLAREGHHEAADALLSQSKASHPGLATAFSAGSSGADHRTIQEITAIADKLRADRKDALPAALQWAQRHASRLRRIESVLEFEIRKQQFIEIVRTGDLPAALSFASSCLAPAAKAATPEAPAAPPAGAVGAAAAEASNTNSTSAAPAAPSTATSASAAGPGTTLEDGLSLFRAHSFLGQQQQAAAPRDTPLSTLQQVMSLLAFSDPLKSGLPHVERLFDEPETYGALARRFEADALCASGFYHCSPLQHAVATGLMALKTSSCKTINESRAELIPIPQYALGISAAADTAGAEGARGDDDSDDDDDSDSAPAAVLKGVVLQPELPSFVGGASKAAGQPPPSHGCPVCAPCYFPSSLANSLPFFRPPHSRLLDPITGEEMSGDNYPLAVAETGNVYGAKTMELLTTTTTCTTAEGEGDSEEESNKCQYVIDPRAASAGPPITATSSSGAGDASGRDDVSDGDGRKQMPRPQAFPAATSVRRVFII